MHLFSFYSGNNQPYTPRLVLLFANNWSSDLIWMFSFISKKISDKKFCTWDIICENITGIYF
jgi:hypothetical protein